MWTMLKVMALVIVVSVLMACSITLKVNSPISDTEVDVVECSFAWSDNWINCEKLIDVEGGDI